MLNSTRSYPHDPCRQPAPRPDGLIAVNHAHDDPVNRSARTGFTKQHCAPRSPRSYAINAISASTSPATGSSASP